jgi:hypothetical protein
MIAAWRWTGDRPCANLGTGTTVAAPPHAGQLAAVGHDRPEPVGSECGMGTLCDVMKGASTRVWRRFFPKRIEPDGCVLDLLGLVYPTVDWGRVRFHDGWPHLIGLSPNAAITLPDTYTPHRVRVYLKPGRWNPCSRSGLGLIVHEGFHVLQIRDVLGGLGLGFARPFIVQYLASWAAIGFRYDGHPMEDAAYAVAGRSTSIFEGCCGPTRRPCDCSSLPPTVDETGLRNLGTDRAQVVQRSSGIDFWRDMMHGTPGLRWLHRTAKRSAHRSSRSRHGDEARVPTPAAPAARAAEPDPSAPRVPRGGNSTRSRRILPARWIADVGGLVVAGLLYLAVGLSYLLWTILWSLVTLVLWLLRILVELVGIVVSGIMWAVTGIVCTVGWTWARLPAARARSPRGSSA